jgi:hypothetical protein
MPAASIRMTLTVILAGMVVMAMTPEQEKQAADLARAAHDATRVNVVTDAVPDAGEECSISEEARGECSNGKFVPSAVWQEVFEGQVVPEVSFSLTPCLACLRLLLLIVFRLVSVCPAIPSLL